MDSPSSERHLLSYFMTTAMKISYPKHYIKGCSFLASRENWCILRLNLFSCRYKYSQPQCTFCQSYKNNLNSNINEILYNSTFRDCCKLPVSQHQAIVRLIILSAGSFASVVQRPQRLFLYW
jgi:hypothetical protein